MEKVHILIWTSTLEIGDVYSDYEKACIMAKNANKKRTWRHKLLSSEWVVKSFDVKG